MPLVVGQGYDIYAPLQKKEGAYSFAHVGQSVGSPQNKLCIQ